MAKRGILFERTPMRWPQMPDSKDLIEIISTKIQPFWLDSLRTDPVQLNGCGFDNIVDPT